MEEFPIVIVGTGFSGIAAAIQLRRAGIESFTILEKAADIGGTWRDNTYPGAACDIPSHLYSFSFEPKPDWSRSFSGQEEIRAYLQHCVEKYDLRRHMRFGCEVAGAEFDEAAGAWTVRLAGGETLQARALIVGAGALNVPAYPDIPGLEEFRGKLFHSNRWDHDYDLTGKTVAVIGTGASAIQFVPEIAPKVARLHVFQRTAPWVLPKEDFVVRPWVRALFRRAPYLQRLYRASIYWRLELRFAGVLLNRRFAKVLERLARRHLATAVADPVLRAKLTPSYTMFCKRILLSNDYYPALQRDNVELVTDGIERITERGLRTHDGVERPVDAIVCGTGFTVSDYLKRLHVVGRGGRTLAATMREDGASHLGITVSGFPNLFFLMGPNTGLGHNSMIFMIEAQARYAVQAIERLRSDRLRFLDVRAPVQEAEHARVRAALGRSVWESGCRSWYAQNGVNDTIWPSYTFQYWWKTRRFALDDHEVAARQAAEPGAGEAAARAASRRGSAPRAAAPARRARPDAAPTALADHG